MKIVTRLAAFRSLFVPFPKRQVQYHHNADESLSTSKQPEKVMLLPYNSIQHLFQMAILTIDLVLEPMVELKRYLYNNYKMFMNDSWQKHKVCSHFTMIYRNSLYLQCTFRETRLLTDGGTSLLAMQKQAPICRRSNLDRRS